MATIVHFNISADNPERAKTFYEKAFGWKFTHLPEPMNYYLIETEDTGGAKGIGGGMYSRHDPGAPGLINFVGVDSLDDAIERIPDLGGKIIVPRQVVPNWGYFAVCADTENNQIGIFEDDEQAH
jgi:uncharacterized protein